MKTKLLLLLLLANFSIYAQTTSIPDVEFEKKLISLGIDSGTTDGKVLTANITNLTSLDISSSSISNLTGIEAFTSLTSLDFSGNKLTSINLSGNTNLTSLKANGNKLNSLSVTANTKLRSLYCQNNQLAAINVSANTALEFLVVNSNLLTSLDVSALKVLNTLWCYSNEIKTLDVTQNTKLVNLDCSSNLITSLDISANKTLQSIDCSANKLTFLNLKNGNNSNFSSFSLSFKDNSGLTCIQVDDQTYAANNWSSYKDATATFKTTCDDGLAYTLIPDINFENQLISLGIDSGAPDGKVLTSKIATVTNLSVSNSNISDLKGIEDFIALKSLNCGNNQLKTLDVSKNVLLETLGCGQNQITSLDVTKNVKLTDFSCYNNKITSLDISKNKALLDFRCFSNDINSIDLSSNTELTTIYVHGSRLASLDLTNNLKLTYISCGSNQISSLKVSHLKSLSELYVSNLPNLKTIDLSGNLLLTKLDATFGKFTALDVTKNTQLVSLTINYSPITSLDLSKNILLKTLDCSNNQLTNLDVSNNLQLGTLAFNSNKITSIDLSKNLALVNLKADSNNLTSLDLSKNQILVNANVSSNKLLKLNLKNGKNTILNKTSLFFTSNPSLTCIEVDDATYSNTNWGTAKDATASYNSNCNQYTAIPDSAFEDKLIELNIDTDGKNGLVLNSNIASLTTLNVANSNIKDLSGIEGFTALKNLNVSGNLLSSLDLSKNASLNSLNSLNNTKLTCIQVANVENATANWTILKDNIASLNINCTQYTLIPDPKFEAKLIALGYDTDGLNGKVATNNIKNVPSLDVSYSSISDLTGIEDFTALKVLSTYVNPITKLDLSKNINLESLDCSSNSGSGAGGGSGNLTSLDLSKNVNLKILNCSKNKITELNVAAFTKLEHLNFGFNFIKNIVLPTNLISIYFEANPIENIDLSGNKELTLVGAEFAPLKTLDLSQNTKLKTLYASRLKLKTLDISKNTALNYIECDYNSELLNLNLKNGNNVNFRVIEGLYSFKNNPKLTCIQVDDATFSNNNWADLKDATASYSASCTFIESYTLIPDVNFEKKLISLGIDNDGQNGKVITSRIELLTSLDVQSSSIKDLTGIQDFTSLTYLNCSTNTLTSLDLSKNTVLENLYAQKNELASLNTSANTSLKVLNLGTNKLSALNISALTKLEELNVSSNAITSLNVSASKGLKTLNCGNNKLTNLNVAANTALTTLYCFNNQITSLEVSSNILLENFMCNGNKLTALNVSKNPALIMLDCFENQITSLDISNNPKITELACNNNLLTSLNLKNGNNTKLDLTFSNFKNNAKLTCIEVDNESYSTTNWSAIKDATANYNVDCRPYTLIPDAAFEDKLIALQIDKDGKNGKVVTSSIAVVTTLDVSSSSIKDLTGIQDFVSLKVLNCSTNQLTSLTPANNLTLTELNVSYNALTTLDVSKNKALTALNVSNNNLNSLNVKNGFNTNMDWFSVNFTKNASLSCIQVDNAKYSNDNWNGKLDKTSYFTEDCSAFTLIPDSNFEDQLIALKIDIDGKNGKVLTSTISTVKDLNVQLSDIKDLTGIQDFTSLEYLNCQFNLLTSLNVSKNSKLIELYTHGNDLTTLDVSANTALTTLYANKNKLTALDLSKNSKLVYVNVAENSLKTLNLKNGNNSNFTGALLNKNTSLTCITVDNPSFAASSGVFFKDAAASYSATCTLGLEDSVFSKATVFPNPTKGEVNINNVSLEKATVYNSLGQLVKTFVFNNGETSNTINLSGLPRGVYFVYLISGDAASAKKIIVE